MATIGDTITAALQDIGVVEAGESPASDDSALALARVNEWIDGLANENLTLYTRLRTTWTITGAASYTVGSGADINVVRPVSPEAITAIGYQDTSVSPTLERLLPLLTEDAYAAIPQKALTGVYPQAFYYNPTLTTGTLIQYPLPTSATLQGVIYTQIALTEFAALTTTFTLPPGYKRWFRTQLTIEIAAAFQINPPASLVKIAADSMATIKRTNTRRLDMRYPRGAYVQRPGGWYDITSGGYV